MKTSFHALLLIHAGAALGLAAGVALVTIDGHDRDRRASPTAHRVVASCATRPSPEPLYAALPDDGGASARRFIAREATAGMRSDPRGRGPVHRTSRLARAR